MKLSHLLSRFDRLEEQADGWLALCPSHADSDPSLRLAVTDERKAIVKCRAGCDTGAVLVAVGLTFADLFDVTVDREPARRAATGDTPASPAAVAELAVRLDGWAAELLADRMTFTDDRTYSGTALAYAESRFGVGRGDAERLGLGLALDLGGGPRLVVPFRDAAGVPRGFQARALEPKAAVRWLGPANPDGGTWAKVGILPGAAGSSWDEVVVTEGPGDGLTACAVGYDVAFIRGAALATNPAVVDEVAAFVGDRTAVVAGDGDPAGRAFSSALAGALSAKGVRAKILAVPDDADLTDWRAVAPATFAVDFVRAVTQAEAVSSYGAALAGWDEDAYPLTDLGAARYLRDYVASVGSGIRYSPETGFYLADGGVWRLDRLDRTRAFAQEVADLVAAIAKDLVREAALDDEKKRAARFARFSAHVQSSRGIDAMLREVQALRDVAVDVNDFDRHDHLLAVRNGVVNLRTGELSPLDASLLLTRRVNIDFHPDAPAPRWERFLAEVFPDHPDLPAYIRRLVGYGITGSTTEQCFAVLFGTGANGKSVFTDTLTQLFREHTTTTPFATFEERSSGGIPNDLAALKGARLVMASEGEQGRPMAEAILKRVTGTEMISARFMRREFFEFRPTFLLLLGTNFKPQFRGQDEGLWRRVKLIPWERYFAPAERDHRLGEHLLAEAEGILAWAVRGASEWYAGGLRDPDVIRKGTTEYRETSDALHGFLPGKFEHGSVDDVVSGGDLWEGYLTWAGEENLPAREQWTRRTFFGALEERGLVKRKRGSGVVFLGVRPAGPHADDAPVEKKSSPLRAKTPPPADSPVDRTPAPRLPLNGPSLEDL